MRPPSAAFTPLKIEKVSERKLVRGISRSPRRDLILKPALEMFIAKASPLTRETLDSPFVPTKAIDFTMVGLRSSFSVKSVEPDMCSVPIVPFTVDPSFSMAFALMVVVASCANVL